MSFIADGCSVQDPGSEQQAEYRSEHHNEQRCSRPIRESQPSAGPESGNSRNSGSSETIGPCRVAAVDALVGDTHGDREQSAGRRRHAKAQPGRRLLASRDLVDHGERRAGDACGETQHNRCTQPGTLVNIEAPLV